MALQPRRVDDRELELPSSHAPEDDHDPLAPIRTPRAPNSDVDEDERGISYVNLAANLDVTKNIK